MLYNYSTCSSTFFNYFYVLLSSYFFHCAQANKHYENKNHHSQDRCFCCCLLHVQTECYQNLVTLSNLIYNICIQYIFIGFLFSLCLWLPALGFTVYPRIIFWVRRRRRSEFPGAQPDVVSLFLVVVIVVGRRPLQFQEL